MHNECQCKVRMEAASQQKLPAGKYSKQSLQVLWVFQCEPSCDRYGSHVFTRTHYQLQQQQFTAGYDLLSPKEVFVGLWEGSEQRNHYLVLHHLRFEERGLIWPHSPSGTWFLGGWLQNAAAFRGGGTPPACQ